MRPQRQQRNTSGLGWSFAAQRVVSLNPIPCQVEYWRHTAGVALDQSKLATSHLHFRSLLAERNCVQDSSILGHRFFRLVTKGAKCTSTNFRCRKPSTHVHRKPTRTQVVPPLSQRTARDTERGPRILSRAYSPDISEL